MGVLGVLVHLASRLDSLPDTKVDEDPDGHQTEEHLPVHPTRVVQPLRDTQDLVPEGRRDGEERHRGDERERGGER